MRKYLFAATAALTIASPAVAKDGSGYFGGDIGAVWPKSQNIDGVVTFSGPVVCNPTSPPIPCTTPPSFSSNNIADIKYKAGIDADLIGGYDFGMFRVEGEVGYKHGKIKHHDFDSAFLDAINDAAGTSLTNFDIDRTTNVWSGMVNGWLDFGGNGGFGGGVGVGAGYAAVHQFGKSDGKFAWQILGQAYYPISESIDIGLKYRYFHAGSGDSEQAFGFTAPSACNAIPPDVCTGGTVVLEDRSKWSSHSLLLSLVYNFGAPPPPPPPLPPPPPPPPPPATQTCPDGSVILATDTCPAPPPPPPPPPPVERGERGN